MYPNRELMALDDRLLHDIGLHGDQIPAAVEGLLRNESNPVAKLRAYVATVAVRQSDAANDDRPRGLRATAPDRLGRLRLDLRYVAYWTNDCFLISKRTFCATAVTDETLFITTAKRNLQLRRLAKYPVIIR